MNNITACLITKDDYNIAKAIDSVRSSCNEIVVVFNGTDETYYEWLKGIEGIKVYRFKWCDDFSKARNYGISKATGDWILSIDTDEVLSGQIKNINENITYYLFRIVNRDDESDGWNCRLFKNGLGIKYVNMIHEVVPVSEKSCNVNDIKFIHSGLKERTPEELEAKFERNFRILLKDKKNTMRNYHFANLYNVKGNHFKAIEYAVKSLCDNIAKEFKAIMCNVIYTAYIRLALNSLKESLEYCPNQIFARINLAHYLEQENQTDLLLEQLKNIVTVTENDLGTVPCDIKININQIKNKIKEIQKVERNAA